MNKSVKSKDILKTKFAVCNWIIENQSWYNNNDPVLFIFYPNNW